MERRKDNKGKVLMKGESQRSDLTYMYRYNNVNGVRCYVYAKTLNELRAKEAEINKDSVYGIQTNNQTLNQTFDRFLEQKTKIKPRTKYKYLIEYDRWVRNTWIGQRKLKDITKSDVLLFYKSLKENKGFSNGTIKCVHKYINGTLKMAFEDDLIRKNYAEGCCDDYSEQSSRESMTKKETRILLEAAESVDFGKKYLLIVKLMLLTGLRVGEATGLTWKDIDLKNRIINVDHQFVLGDDKSRTAYHIDTTKTKKSLRKVPMTDDLYEILLHLKETTYFDAFKFGTKLDGYSGFVVHSRTGLPILKERINEYIKRVINIYNETHEDKLRTDISCHTCRHTFCTRAAEYGMNIHAIQRIAGHSSIKTTTDFYIDVSDDFVNEEFFRVMRGVS